MPPHPARAREVLPPRAALYGAAGPTAAAGFIPALCGPLPRLLTPFSTDLRGWLLSLTAAPRPRATANSGRSSHLFERAFNINADASTERREFMEQQLRASGVPFDRWLAVQGAQRSRRANAIARGVERHLLKPQLHRTDHRLGHRCYVPEPPHSLRAHRPEVGAQRERCVPHPAG